MVTSTLQILYTHDVFTSCYHDFIN